MSDPGAQAAPRCYRHPDRETYVRCSRCDRPICPDCMISASVGYQCPECVREGNRGVRQPRTALGGALAGREAMVTKIIVAINVVVFGVQQLGGDPFVARFELIGDRPFDPALGEPVGVADGEYFRLLTAAFLHAGVLHLALNMIALLVLGPQLEALLGRVRFTALYLLAAVGGTAASYAFNLPQSASLGASGAIFGLFGALLVIARRLRLDVSFLLIVLGANLLLGFGSASIDWKAHLGGLAVGLVLGAAFAYAPPARRRLVAQGACLGVLLVVALGVAARTVSLTS
jgi:membrane associated rhomboid family serine protease